MNILVVEDNGKLASNLVEVLAAEGYTSHTTTNYDGALEMIAMHSYHLLLLDIGIEGGDGIELCREIREQGYKMPILMLTARIDTDGKVSSLDSGADDYLCKPFEVEELLARVRALLRRQSDAQGSLIHLTGDVEVDMRRHLVTKLGAVVDLSPIEFEIVKYLAFNRGSAKTPIDIYDGAWGDGSDAVSFSSTLKVHIAAIRRKLGKEIVTTVKGVGYMIA